MIINYVPGYGYCWFVFWMIGVMVLFVVSIIRKSMPFAIAFFTSFVYWVFWLLIPVFGYTWFFAWRCAITCHYHWRELMLTPSHEGPCHRQHDSATSSNLRPPMAAPARVVPPQVH